MAPFCIVTFCLILCAFVFIFFVCVCIYVCVEHIHVYVCCVCTCMYMCVCVRACVHVPMTVCPTQCSSVIQVSVSDGGLRLGSERVSHLAICCWPSLLMLAKMWVLPNVVTFSLYVSFSVFEVIQAQCAVIQGAVLSMTITHSSEKLGFVVKTWGAVLTVTDDCVQEFNPVQWLPRLTGISRFKCLHFVFLLLNLLLFF